MLAGIKSILKCQVDLRPLPELTSRDLGGGGILPVED